MENVRQIPTKLNKLNWIVPACFGCSCALLAAAISLLMVRGFDNMEHSWLFSIGADLFCMAVCVMLCFSCVLNFKRRNEHTRVFVGLLTTNAMAMFLDEAAWLVQGIPQFRTLNLIINVLFYMNGVVLIYEFWQYVRRVLKMENSLMRAADSILNLLLIPTLLLCLVNFFYPLYFMVDENGWYQRCDNVEEGQAGRFFVRRNSSDKSAAHAVHIRNLDTVRRDARIDRPYLRRAVRGA